MIRLFLSTILTFLAINCHAKPLQWQNIAPGMDYTMIHLTSMGSRGKLHAFKVDLNNYRFDVVLARDYQRAASSVRNLGTEANAWLSINGGFFTPDLQPLGLRMDQGVIRNSLKKISWWGIFYIKDGKAFIVPQSQFKLNRQIDFAVQAGPRLLVNRQIPKLKEGLAERTALGITDDGKVMVVVTEHASISTEDLAKLFKKPESKGGLGCRHALNLDGGSSSQLFAKMNKFYLNVPNFSPVTDIIAVRPIATRKSSQS